MDNTVIEVFFTLTGDFDPDVITSLLGIQPTKVWRKGDVRPNVTGYATYKNSGWYIGTGEIQEYSLDKPIEDILKKVYPLKNAINDIHNRMEISADIACYVAVDKTPPSIVLSHAILSQVVELNAYIDISMNLLSEYEN